MTSGQDRWSHKYRIRLIGLLIHPLALLNILTYNDRVLIKKIDPKNPDEDLITEAAEVLKTGGIVAFPTDTVYGIAAMPFDKKAVSRLYRIKGRDRQKPITLLVSSRSAVSGFASSLPAKARQLIRKHWPGPLTLILPKKKNVPDFLTAGLPSIGIRMPKNKIALKLIKAVGGALAVTSANRSGGKPAISAKEIRGLKGLHILIDGGRCKIGIPSSVVAVQGKTVKILRKGSLKLES